MPEGELTSFTVYDAYRYLGRLQMQDRNYEDQIKQRPKCTGGKWRTNSKYWKMQDWKRRTKNKAG